ncbi:hypothetical protein ACFSHP_09095 [Novosphingobium panipatense]
MADRAALHPGLSGVHLLADAVDAFAARLLLVQAAECTIDLQYYIWHGDRTGTLLLEAVHEAAERGCGSGSCWMTTVSPVWTVCWRP